MSKTAVEILGILATVFVLISFTSSSKIFIRVVNSIGSIFFVIYGWQLQAHSVYILNGAVFAVNMYKLYKEHSPQAVSLRKELSEAFDMWLHSIFGQK